MRNEKPHAECERSRQWRNSKMPPSLAHAIGAPAENEHADQACHKRNRAHPANALNVRPTGDSLEHRRKPKPKGVSAGIGEEQPGGEHQHRWMSKCSPNRDLLRMRLRAPFFVEASSNPIAFVRRKPSCILRAIRKHKERRCTEQHRRNTFEQKQPTPAGSFEPIRTENGAGNRSAHDETNWNRRHESRHCLGPVPINEPVRKVNNHPREKSCFSRAQQKSGAVKLHWCSHEAG